MTENLNTLRFLASQLADYPSAAIRERAAEMVRQIDAMAAPPPKPRAWRRGMDASTIPEAVLTAEMERRQKRHEPSMCSRCGTRPARVAGKCRHCYQVDYWHARNARECCGERPRA